MSDVRQSARGRFIVLHICTFMLFKCYVVLWFSLNRGSAGSNNFKAVIVSYRNVSEVQKMRANCFRGGLRRQLFIPFIADKSFAVLQII